MPQFHGFPPLFDADSKILILGSFPSVKSRMQSFYYGNAQNRFWKTLCKAFCSEVHTVEDKKRLCLSHGIALWDIVVACDIRGSMDSDIKNYVLADLSAVLNSCNIQKILCNGAKAYELTKLAYNGQIPLIKMPSTSPANVSFSEKAWIEQLLNI